VVYMEKSIVWPYRNQAFFLMNVLGRWNCRINSSGTLSQSYVTGSAKPFSHFMS